MKSRIRTILDRAGGAHDRRGFTLLEILVAVAALSLIAVGIAKIFDSVGKTITAGKRVSAFSAYASLIEQQLRADISSMTRRGFLVIRNEYAQPSAAPVDPSILTGNVNAVPLYEGDESPRIRRVDELLFFANGEYVSARAALDPSYVARSDSARIYYGHGQRARPPAAFNQDDPYYMPELNGANSWTGTNADPQSRLGYDSPENPNHFASSWTLLRHVTLLCPPRTSEITPNISPFGLPVGSFRLVDSDVQVALQPASSNVFRALSALFPTTAVTTLRPGNTAQHPFFASALIDIATTDLSEIRSIVTTATVYPGPGITAGFFDPRLNLNPSETGNQGVDGIFRIHGLTGTVDKSVIDRSQSWMDDAFPTNSMASSLNNRARMRYEPSPPNYIGAVTRAWSGADQNLEAAYRVADQVMLSSSNFLPRCTEFIVEWSFGKTYPSDPAATGYDANKAGQIIWHGMQRRVGSGATNIIVDYYRDTDPARPFARNTTPLTAFNGATGQQVVQTRLIHGENAQTTPPVPGAPLTSYFGYLDPTFNPDTNNNGTLEDPTDWNTPTIPWAWPKLIRVTLSLADPNDPSIERTFQYVFQVPEKDGV